MTDILRMTARCQGDIQGQRMPAQQRRGVIKQDSDAHTAGVTCQLTPLLGSELGVKTSCFCQ